MRDPFDEALQAIKIGRRYHSKNPGWWLDHLTSGLPGMVEGILQSMRDDRRRRGVGENTVPNVLSGVCDSPNFNACAFEHGGQYVLAINYGALILVEDLVKRLFCVPEAFPWVGDPKAEDPNRSFHPTSTDAMDYMRRFIAEPKRTDPRDPIRRKAATLFLIAAVEFIVCHELWHILGGHVRWYQQRTAGLTLSEVRDSDPRSDGITYQALEMHADGFAVWISLIRMLQMARSEAPPPHIPRVILNPTQAVESTLLCALVMVGTFLGGHSSPSDWPTLTHPPPGIRHQLNLAAIARSLHYLGEHDVKSATTDNKEWAELFGKSVFQPAWMRIGNPSWQDAFPLSLGRLGFEHAQRISKRLAELQPELNALAHMPSPGQAEAAAQTASTFDFADT